MNNHLNLLAAFAQKHILVLGDVMLDETQRGRIARLSPEAPVPVLEIEAVDYYPGGAANVAANLASLGAGTELYGVVGADEAGRRLQELCRQRKIDPRGLLVEVSRPTTLKTRLLDQGQHVLRLDREQRLPLASELQAALGAMIADRMVYVDALVISDYAKGVAQPTLLQGIIQAARRLDKPVIVAPKGSEYSKYNGATAIIANRLEAAQILGAAIDGESSLAQAARAILQTCACQAVLITRGAEGLSVYQPRGNGLHIPATAQEVCDVTGAGDTVLATFTLALTAGVCVEDCARLANVAGGIVVAEPGTATVRPDRLMAVSWSATPKPLPH